MKPTGAIVKLGWGDTYYFEKMEQALDLLSILAKGQRCDQDWCDGKSYLVERDATCPSVELVYKTIITQEEMSDIRKAAEAAKQQPEEN